MDKATGRKYGDAVAKVKVGFAGAGFMGQVAHLTNYVDNPECEVVALAEPRAELARKVAERYGIPRVYKSHMELVDNADVEAVVAAQPHLLNGYIAIPLLKAGKSCFVEKPMAGSLEEAEDMVEAAEAGGAQLMVGFMKRYDSGVERARSCIEALRATKAMGELDMVSAYCFGGDWLQNVERPITTDEPVPANDGFVPRNPGWMDEKQKETFNIYMNIFAHNINLVRHLLARKLEVKTALLREGKLNQCTMLESDGVIVTLYGMPVEANHWEEQTDIYFDQGWVRLRTPAPMARQSSAVTEIYHGADVQETRTLYGEPYWAFRAQADHFVACVKSKKIPRSNGVDCLEDMQLMEDVFRKAEWV